MATAAMALGLLMLPTGVGPVSGQVSVALLLLFATGVFIDVRYRRPLTGSDGPTPRK
jgi:hypothetical protein